MSVRQQAAAGPSPSPPAAAHQSEGDVQQRQQDEQRCLQQLLQHLSTDVDQLATDMRHMSVTNAQVTYPENPENPGEPIRLNESSLEHTDAFKMD